MLFLWQQIAELLVDGRRPQLEKPLCLSLSRACPALQIMHRISVPWAVPHQKVSGTFWQLHRGITTMLLKKGSVNDPAQLADSPTEVEQSLCVSAVVMFGQGRAWSTSTAELNIAGNSRTKPAQPILQTVINTRPRDSIFYSNIVQKYQDLNHLAHYKYIIPKLWLNRKAQPDFVTNQWWVSVFFQRQGHTSSQSLLQSFPGSQRENWAWKGVKSDLSHLCFSHQWFKLPHPGIWNWSAFRKVSITGASLAHFWAQLHG